MAVFAPPVSRPGVFGPRNVRMSSTKTSTSGPYEILRCTGPGLWGDIGKYSWNACAARAARTSTDFSLYRASPPASVRTSPGNQLLVTSWSSHCTITGTSVLRRRRFSSSRLYRHWPRYSSRVSATLLFSGVTMFRHVEPSGSATSGTSGPSA
jgi:hypothetical protein